MVLGIKAFEVYLTGKPFILQTDHGALRWLQNFKDKNSRLTRWSLALQPYTFSVQYRKGSENMNADALSRLDSTPALRAQEGERCKGHIIQDLDLEDQIPLN